MKEGFKKYLIASSILIGSCIGAGVLGIPYVASQAGFFVAFLYILLIGGMIFLVNLYLGEVALRTKGDHQLIGYAEKYLGKKSKHVMEFAFIFGAYAAMIAFMLGMGKSLSFLFFQNTNYEIYFGVGVGLLMSILFRGGMKSLKKFEKLGVFLILFLLVVIVAIFLPQVDFMNLLGFDKANLILPFGVILFALMSFDAIPEVKILMKNNERRFKKVLFTGTFVSVVFYSLFTLVVLGVNGEKTPQVATLSLGPIFIFLGMFTMFTSYLVKGNALRESFVFDERIDKTVGWVLASFVPIGLFLLTQLTSFFSFTRILSIGGVVSGGIIAIVVLLMIKKAKRHCSRKPEYEIPAPWWLVVLLILIFAAGVVRELLI